jgi:hypothetical protein
MRDKEEILFYDPRSSLLLELVEEYIEHDLLLEAETLLKDYLKSTPMDKRAISLWIKIAQKQGDKDKEEYLIKKMSEISEIKEDKVREEVKVKEEEKEEREIIKEEFLNFLKDIDEIEKISRDDETIPFLTFLEPYFRKWGVGNIQSFIIESDISGVGVKDKNGWFFIKFRKNVNFVSLTWALKKLEKI